MVVPEQEFLCSIDSRLESIHRAIPAAPKRVPGQVREFLTSVTESRPRAGVAGIEPNTLLNPGWEWEPQRNPPAATRLFILGEDGFLSPDQAEALYELCRAMIRLIRDGKTSGRTRFLLEEVRGRLEDYLELRKSDFQPSLTREEANEWAKQLANRDSSFIDLPCRDWSQRIEECSGRKCSESLVRKTAMWQGVMEQRGRKRQKGNRKPKRSRVGSDLLDQLVAEQQRDAEPSPLDDAPRRLRLKTPSV
jgi:hypothetical protein